VAARHLERGAKGEAAAKRLLKKKGYKILVENWRGAGCELDMVAVKGHDLVFVEVKARAKTGMAAPAEAVTFEKRRRLLRAARQYLSENNLWESRCRFDVVLVSFPDRDNENPETEHIENAFDFSDAVGRGDAPWQPW
jgi:putative endonuclease